jgi:hypothetical protein
MNSNPGLTLTQKQFEEFLTFISRNYLKLDKTDVFTDFNMKSNNKIENI